MGLARFLARSKPLDRSPEKGALRVAQPAGKLGVASKVVVVCDRGHAAERDQGRAGRIDGSGGGGGGRGADRFATSGQACGGAGRGSALADRAGGYRLGAGRSAPTADHPAT